MQRNPAFSRGTQLKPLAVYAAALGVFASYPEYECIAVIHGDDHGGTTERARIYRKKTDEAEDQYHVLYYPGKDNENPLSLANTTLPLKEIREYVDQQIKIKHPDIPSAQIIKHFFICESNGFRIPLPFSSRHFIYGKVTHNTAHMEDSMGTARAWLYAESGAAAAITDLTEVTSTHRGWQGLSDKWQCGYYMLAALHRNLDATRVTPEYFAITQNEVDDYERFFQVGADAIETDAEEENDAKQRISSESESDEGIEEQVDAEDSVIQPPALPPRTWVRNLSIALIFVGAAILSLGIAAITGGFGSVLTPVFFGLAIAGCVAGGLLTTTGWAGVINFLKNTFGQNKKADQASRSAEKVNGTHASVHQALSPGQTPPLSGMPQSPSTSSEDSTEQQQPRLDSQQVTLTHRPARRRGN